MSTSDSPITVLLCGAGSRGRTIFGQFALDNPELCRVTAVAEPMESKREAVAEEHAIGPEFVFGDWKEIDFTKPLADVAIVATDDRDHLEPALAFLGADYHLLLEKPMAPNLEDCEKIVAAADRSQKLSAICHVLRYTHYFRTLRRLIEEGSVGKPLCIRHLEPVNYWHFAHSFVRGNWRNSQIASPFILAKCCHDMDILLYLMGEQPKAVQSFGELSHFRASSAPEKSSDRCWSCDLKTECAYSATRFYGDMLQAGLNCWPLDVVIDDFTASSLENALRTGPYGRCVYHCDNDVPDHQVVNLQFASGSTASVVATAFTDEPARVTEVLGDQGVLKGDGTKIEHLDFRTRKRRTYEVEGAGEHHLGGDEAMLREFLQAVREEDGSRLSSTPAVSLASHRMALLAERSRLTGTVQFL